MGYTRIIQYGDITEHYQYQNEIRKKNKDLITILSKKENIKRIIKKRKNKPLRTTRSIKRAKDNFRKLVYHNVINSETVFFCTLTLAIDKDKKTFQRYLSRFYTKIKKHYEKTGYKKVRYIATLENTKNGRLHYHILLFNLPSTTHIDERVNRNLQRQYNRGYLDLRPTKDRSPKIASYMVKYLTKTFSENPDIRRAYNCSRNIERPSIYSNNQIPIELDLIIDQDTIDKIYEYHVPYLGKCLKKIYKNNNHATNQNTSQNPISTV